MGTEREHVAAWPRISATVRPDGTGTMTINGTERPCAAQSVDELRTGIIARCVTLARRLHRPVRLTVDDGTVSWVLAVRASGVVQLVDDAGAIAAAADLVPHEGRCRACRHLEPVTTPACSQCGLDEPHRVESDPTVSRQTVPEAAAATGSLHQAEPGTGSPLGPVQRALLLEFATRSPVQTETGVAVGRNPEPVGGRHPVPVDSPERMLSRTHALIDLDEAGRIIVTDYHSGNGIEAQTLPPARLEPGTPYVVSPGTQLLLGDVAVLVSLA
ncbi:FHA domain-containing protein [Sanguibacter massiliensis]|uniref:FHA domain-containing protein n=1 Tax=Sanguibacter massiliensis TaxID=1973217 RepID=UPI000C81753D|nr:FHA domain-containing protein [Sanguibacter massiliensis]